MQAREILKFIFISNNKKAARRSAAEPAAWSQWCPCQCASDLDNRFFFFIYLYVKKEWGLNIFVLYLMNCVDNNNCVSPTVLGFVGQNNNCSFKRVVPPLFPCLCARFNKLSRCSLSSQPLPFYQEWPWHLSHILSSGTLQCVCSPQDFYRQKTKSWQKEMPLPSITGVIWSHSA